jgi:glyoxylase-like metal-dependent hydrolase (beta-lactamase superfamily II)
VPVPRERVIIAEDGFTLDLNGRVLLFRDTPGHARHHYTIFDAASRGFFTGDIFGLSYREFDGPSGPFIFPTTTPVQFDPGAWHRSLDLLLSYKPERMFLTHYGMVTEVERLADDLRQRLDKLTDIACRAAGRADRHQKILKDMTELLVEELARSACPLAKDQAIELFSLDLELNAQGLEVWLDRDATLS